MDGEITLIGIASWAAVPCGNAPGVFTLVSAYINWIEGEVQNN